MFACALFHVDQLSLGLFSPRWEVWMKTKCLGFTDQCNVMICHSAHQWTLNWMAAHRDSANNYLTGSSPLLELSAGLSNLRYKNSPFNNDWRKSPELSSCFLLPCWVNPCHSSIRTRPLKCELSSTNKTATFMTFPLDRCVVSYPAPSSLETGNGPFAWISKCCLWN